jgi:hypothetical protein
MGMRVRQFLKTIGRVALSPPSRGAVYTTALCVLCSLLLFIGWDAKGDPTPTFPVDDAYITLHNAIALRNRVDPNYAGVPALTGSTSGVHVVLVALFSFVLEPLRALWASMILGAVLYAVGLFRLGQAHGASLLACVLALASGIFVAHTPHQLMNGLETGLALAGTTWALALSAEPRAFERKWLLILVGMLPFLRPELAALDAFLLAYMVRDVVQSEPQENRMRALIRVAGWVALGALPWMVAYWVSVGMPYPNTLQAKRFFFAEGCAPAAMKWSVVWDMLQEFCGQLAYLSVAGVIAFASRSGRVALAFAMVFLCAYFISLPGALGHYTHRYMYVLVPGFLAAVLAATVHARRTLRVAGHVVLLLTAGEAIWHAPERWAQHLRGRDFTRFELAAVANWAKANLPPDARVRLHDAGYFSWGTPFTLSDFVGLKTPSAIPFHRRFTWSVCMAQPEGVDGWDRRARVEVARVRAIDGFARESHSTHLVMLTGWDELYNVTGRLRELGWVVQPMRTAPGYNVYALTPAPLP